jgi:hypothetical protein
VERHAWYFDGMTRKGWSGGEGKDSKSVDGRLGTGKG